MSNLKTLTWANHKRAESTQLMQDMLTGDIDSGLYSDLVWSKHQLYKTIESRITFECSDVPRARWAYQDWVNMGKIQPTQTHSFQTLQERLLTVDEKKLWAHVYVHYLAPLYGGQILKRILGPRFPVSMLEFSTPMAAIAEIRYKTSPDLADEANLSFDLTTRYYDELYQTHHPDS